MNKKCKKNTKNIFTVTHKYSLFTSSSAIYLEVNTYNNFVEILIIAISKQFYIYYVRVYIN